MLNALFTSLILNNTWENLTACADGTCKMVEQTAKLECKMVEQTAKLKEVITKFRKNTWKEASNKFKPDENLYSYLINLNMTGLKNEQGWRFRLVKVKPRCMWILNIYYQMKCKVNVVFKIM